MGLVARLMAGGGLIRFFVRLWLVLVGLIGVACALIAIPSLPGDHSTADSYHHAAACPAGTDPSPDCVSSGTATVRAVSSSFHPGNRTGTGAGTTTTKSQYQTDVTLSAPSAGRSGQTFTQVVTFDTPVSVAGQLPAGTQLPVTMWHNSVITFQALGGQHDSGTDPDATERKDKILLLVGLPVALLTLRLLAWSVFGRRVRRAPFLAADGALVVLAGATIALVLAGAATVGVVVAVVALIVLAASWAGARFGVFGG